MEKLLSFQPEELKSLFLAEGYQSYLAVQIYKWVYSKFILSFDRMSDVPKNIREKLKSGFIIANLSLRDALTDSQSNAIKFLFETSDGNFIESVLIYADDYLSGEDRSRITFCISSQIGCPLACSFCATGHAGFKRNLNISEIISQVLLAEEYLLKNSLQAGSRNTRRKISNIVFMGMGEPLLNYENVIKSISILNNSIGYNLGSRHFTISTSGIVPQIKKLQNEKFQVRLAVSLQSALQAKRASLMPISKKYPLSVLMKTLREYQSITKRRITFEYVLMENINDTETDAAALKDLLSGITFNLNLISFNPAEDLPYFRPSEKSIVKFMEFLSSRKIPFVLRKSKGTEIRAACGQLGQTLIHNS